VPCLRVASPDVAGDTGTEPSQWIIHGERLVDQNPHIRVSLADVELPDGTEFTQYVFRMRRCVIVAVLNEPGSHILMMWRHRFIVGKWVWELPGGYVDDGEDGVAAAVREAEEETGWRPRNVRFLLSFQPMIGNADFPQDLYIGRGADLVREPATDETAAVRWVPLDEAAAMITSGDLAGAASIIGVQHALMQRAGVQLPGR
jgi:8-oxo-dGDP phosphatase